MAKLRKLPTVNKLTQLKEIGFGQPYPRHGLKLLHWFAHDFVNFNDYNNMCWRFDPEEGHFGIQPFVNRPEGDGKRLLPDVAPDYYEVGNLSRSGAEDLPDSVRDGYSVNPKHWDGNRDRILVSVDDECIDRVYVTEHKRWQTGFNKDATYRISKGLIKIIRNLSLEEVFSRTGYSIPQEESIVYDDSYNHGDGDYNDIANDLAKTYIANSDEDDHNYDFNNEIHGDELEDIDVNEDDVADHNRNNDYEENHEEENDVNYNNDLDDGNLHDHLSNHDNDDENDDNDDNVDEDGDDDDEENYNDLDDNVDEDGDLDDLFFNHDDDDDGDGDDDDDDEENYNDLDDNIDEDGDLDDLFSNHDTDDNDDNDDDDENYNDLDDNVDEDGDLDDLFSSHDNDDDEKEGDDDDDENYNDLDENNDEDNNPNDPIYGHDNDDDKNNIDDKYNNKSDDIDGDDGEVGVDGDDDGGDYFEYFDLDADPDDDDQNDDDYWI